MPGSRRITTALAVGACLIGSGCGSDGDDEPATTASPPAATATGTTDPSAPPSAPTTPSTDGGAQAPAPTPGPPSVTVEGRRFTERARRACTRVRRAAKGIPARVPQDPAKLPAFARSVLPVYQESRAALEKERPRRRPVQAIDELIGAYDALLPILQQVAAAPPDAPASDVRGLAQLLPGALARVEGAALAAGIPACGSPRRP